MKDEVERYEMILFYSSFILHLNSYEQAGKTKNFSR